MHLLTAILDLIYPPEPGPGCDEASSRAKAAVFAGLVAAVVLVWAVR
jgi:hypothetical protein